MADRPIYWYLRRLVCMCGFLAEINFTHSSSERLSKFEKSLLSFKYRGPDQSFIASSRSLTVGFNRLAINNLDTGTQPRIFKMSVGSKFESILAFNGEIFNYKELETVYLSTPHTRDEAGVLVDLYKKLGKRFLSLLNGQFALLIFNADSNTLTVSRDPFGIRPLFYTYAKMGLLLALT